MCICARVRFDVCRAVPEHVHVYVHAQMHEHVHAHGLGHLVEDELVADLACLLVDHGVPLHQHVLSLLHVAFIEALGHHGIGICQVEPGDAVAAVVQDVVLVLRGVLHLHHHLLGKGSTDVRKQVT